MQTNLGYLNQRQDVLSQNIANANVPGYQAKDIKAPDFSSMIEKSSNEGGVSVATTDTGHMTIGTTGSGKFQPVAKAIKRGEISPSGNNVILENEVLKMSKNSLEYQQSAEMYRKMLEMLKTAIGNV